MQHPDPSSIPDPIERAQVLLTIASDEDQHALERVWAASRAAQAVHEVTAQAVAVARERGETWTEIGNIFGTSRQAAHERFGRSTLAVDG